MPVGIFLTLGCLDFNARQVREIAKITHRILNLTFVAFVVIPEKLTFISNCSGKNLAIGLFGVTCSLLNPPSLVTELQPSDCLGLNHPWSSEQRWPL